MFPGWSVAQMFEPDTRKRPAPAQAVDIERLLDVIAVGLNNPGSVCREWGTAEPGVERLPASHVKDRLDSPRTINHPTVNHKDDITQKIGRRLITLSKALRLNIEETRQLAGLAGNIVDLELRIGFDIAADGWARVTYHHELLNMGDRPLTRTPRELWFEHTRGPLKIAPVGSGARRVAIQRLHDTANLAMFACQFSPAVLPGETATVGYTCEGGQFVSDHYWRQTMPRYTRHFTIDLRHRGAGHLVNCLASEERPDGSERSAAESLMWDTEGSDVSVMLTRDYLRPGQAVTLRWEVSREPA